MKEGLGLEGPATIGTPSERRVPISNLKAFILDQYEIKHQRSEMLTDLAQDLEAANEANPMLGEIYATSIRSRGKI